MQLDDFGRLDAYRDTEGQRSVVVGVDLLENRQASLRVTVGGLAQVGAVNPESQESGWFPDDRPSAGIASVDDNRESGDINVGDRDLPRNVAHVHSDGARVVTGHHDGGRQGAGLRGGSLKLLSDRAVGACQSDDGVLQLNARRPVVGSADHLDVGGEKDGVGRRTGEDVEHEAELGRAVVNEDASWQGQH